MSDLFNPDYDGVDLPVIFNDLKRIVSSFNETAEGIISIKHLIKKNKDVLKDPAEIIGILDGFGSLFSDFQHDLERVSQEAPDGIHQRHLDCLDQIVERYQYERERVRDIIKDMFSFGIKCDPHGISSEFASSIRGVLYDQLIFNRVILARMRRRLKIFIGSRPMGSEKQNIKTIIPFPADPGTKWQQISIRFLSSNAVELKIGEKHRGNEFAEIGFENKKTGEYSKAWLILAMLGQFETIDEKTSGFPPKFIKRESLIKQIQGLNDLLQGIFTIEGKERAIVFDRKTGCYRANMKVSLNNSDIIDEISDSFKSYVIPKGTKEDMQEMKYRQTK